MDFNLQEDYTEKGRWIINGEECDATIKYEKSGRMYVEYLDSKGKEIMKGINGAKEAAISGILVSGKPITVFGINPGGWKMHLPGMTEVLARVDTAIIGRNYENERDVKYDRVWVKFSGIGEWYNLDNITTREEEGGQGLTISYDPQAYRVDINQNLSLRMAPYVNHGRTERQYLEIKRDVVFEFRSAGVQGMEYWKKVLEKTQLFLSIIIGCPIYPNAIKARTGEEKYGYWDADIIIIPYGRNAKWNKLREIPNLSVLSSNFELAISKWFAEYEELYQYFVSLYVRPMYHEGAFWVNEFLDAIRCVEVYHRLTAQGTQMDSEVYETSVARFVGLLDEGDFKNLVTDSLRYANEMRLNMRLKEVLNLCRNYYAPKLDYAKESYRISSARNYYTHFDKSKSSSELPVYDGVRYTRMLWKAMEIMLFRQLGFDEEVLQTMNDRNMFTRQLPRRKKS